MLRQLLIATLAVAAAGCAEFHSNEAILSLSAGDSARGMGELRRAAEEGRPEAQRLLASILEDGIVLKNGEAVAADPAEAVKWYRKAAEAGDREAMARLGVLHVRGRGVAKDSSKALAMFRRAGLDVDGALRNVAGQGASQGVEASAAWMIAFKQQMMWMVRRYPRDAFRQGDSGEVELTVDATRAEARVADSPVSKLLRSAVADSGKRALELLPPPPEAAKSGLKLSFAVDYRIR